MSAAAEAAAGGKRKKANKILQPAQAPEQSSSSTPAPPAPADPHDEVPIGKRGPVRRSPRHAAAMSCLRRRARERAHARSRVRLRAFPHSCRHARGGARVPSGCSVCRCPYQRKATDCEWPVHGGACLCGATCRTGTPSPAAPNLAVGASALL